MSSRINLEAALDFILNRASEEEMEVLQAAVDRRLGGKLPRDPRQLDFSAMAKQITAEMGGRFKMPAFDQIYQTTRRIVRDMIIQHEPKITEEDLEMLLEQYVPHPDKVRARQESGKEAELPLEALMTMVQQFVAYSIGAMPQRELEDLKQSMPDWTSRYWDAFSIETRKLIADFLKNGGSQEQFWNRFRAHLAETRGG